MPETDVTLNARAAAMRLRNAANLFGNMQVLHQVVYKDPASIEALRVDLSTKGADQAMVDRLVQAHVRASNAMELSGNLQLIPGAIETADWIDEAADWSAAWVEPEP